MKHILIFILILSLFGCVGDSKNTGSNKPVSNQSLPNAPISRPSKAAKAPVFEESPIAEAVDLPSVEKHLKEEIQTSANNNQSQLTGTINTSVSKIAEKIVGVQSDVDSLIKVQTSINSKLDSQFGAFNSMSSKVDDLKATAGRDVNNSQFTADVKDAMKSNNYVTIGAIAIVCLMFFGLTWIQNNKHTEHVKGIIKEISKPCGK